MTEILNGTIHTLPDDMISAISSDIYMLDKRNALTPLARNERICRVTIVTKAETRTKHISRMISDISSGKKRPCCRPGCPHHRSDAMKRFDKNK